MKSEQLHTLLSAPRYHVDELVRLARCSVDEAQQWLGIGSDGYASYLELIDLVAILALTREGVPAETIKRVAAESGRPHPFSTGDVEALRFVFHDGDSKVTVRLHPSDVDFCDGYACRWWPLGREVPVVVDPRYGFGVPVVAGTGVRTEIVAENAEAGESEAGIASDFNLTVAQVVAALEYERLLGPDIVPDEDEPFELEFPLSIVDETGREEDESSPVRY